MKILHWMTGIVQKCIQELELRKCFITGQEKCY